jgi:hypothetical protein
LIVDHRHSIHFRVDRAMFAERACRQIFEARCLKEVEARERGPCEEVAEQGKQQVAWMCHGNLDLASIIPGAVAPVCSRCPVAL